MKRFDPVWISEGLNPHPAILKCRIRIIFFLKGCFRIRLFKGLDIRWISYRNGNSEHTSWVMTYVNNNNLQIECLDLSEFMKYNFNVKDAPIKIEWMCGAQTNICYNALGRVLYDSGKLSVEILYCRDIICRDLLLQEKYPYSPYFYLRWNFSLLRARNSPTCKKWFCGLNFTIPWHGNLMNSSSEYNWHEWSKSGNLVYCEDICWIQFIFKQDLF